MTDSAAPNRERSSGSGPGDHHVPWWGIVLVGIYLIGTTVLCVIALAQMWPHPTPAALAPPPETGTAAPPPGTRAPDPRIAAEIRPEYLEARCGSLNTPGSADCRRCERTAHEMRTHFLRGDAENDPECVEVLWLDVVMWNERRLLLIVILSGALGGLIYAVRSFFWYVGNRDLKTSWIPIYFLAPITSALLGAMIYLVIRGGFFSGMSTIADTSPYTFAALAALVGMFHRETAEKLREIFQIVFTKALSGKDAMERTGPKLTRIKPADKKLSRTTSNRLTLEGEGFGHDMVVTLDTRALTSGVIRVSDKELTVIITPADLTGQDNEVVVRVSDRAQGGASSDGITLAIEPPAEPPPAPEAPDMTAG
jgi:hypothetical protein